MKVLTRTSERKKIVFVIYEALCVGKTIDQALEDNFKCKKEETSIYVQQIINDINENMEEYIQWISKYLKGYQFYRLGYIEQAILLVAKSELQLKTADRAVIINEAVELSKTYCDQDAHKLINGVLDHA